jgi:hypothetical protein
MNAKLIIYALPLMLTFSGCSQRHTGNVQQHSTLVPMNMQQHAEMAAVARESILSKFTDVDSQLLAEDYTGGMLDDAGNLQRYYAEYRLPVGEDGVFEFFRIELDTTKEPPIIHYLNRGKAQTERVINESEYTPLEMK